MLDAAQGPHCTRATARSSFPSDGADPARPLPRPARARSGTLPRGLRRLRRGLPDRTPSARTTQACSWISAAACSAPTAREPARTGAITFTPRLPPGRARRARTWSCGADGAAPWRGALTAGCLRLFGRSLKLRQVSAGGCNACEADVNVLGTMVFDLGRFGIQFVASPRHADGLLVTGPVTENMTLALEKTWAAVPSPKIGHRRGRLRHLRRPLPRPPRGPRRRRGDGAGRPLHPWLPAPPAD